MRTFFWTTTIIVVLGLGYLGYAHFTGGSVPLLGLPLGGERAQVRARTTTFFEHVKFKNASAFKTFISDEASSEEISAYLHKTLGINPNNIDLTSVKINSVELDSSASRARVKITLMGQDLAEKKALSISRIIFLYRNGDGPWLIDIKNLGS